MLHRLRLLFVFLIVYTSIGLSVLAQSPYVTVSFQNNGTCGRNVHFELSGFAPNSSISVDNNPDRIREYECNGQLKQGAGWRGWNIGVYTDGNGNATLSVTHGAYGSYEYIFYDGAGHSASITFEYGSANSPPPPPQPTTSDNQRSGMDLNAFCVSRRFASVERTREGNDAAYSHLCLAGDGSFHAIDMRDVCQFQYGGRLPYVSLGNAGDPGSWSCNSQLQSQPVLGYITYSGSNPQPVSGESNPPPVSPNTNCPSATTNLSLGTIARINTGMLNVRTDPRADAAINFKLAQGTLVTVVSGPSCSGGTRWWQIGTNDGRGGWSAEVSSNGTYFLVSNSSGSDGNTGYNAGNSSGSGQQQARPPEPFVEPNTNLNVRSEPSISSSLIVEVSPGSFYVVVGKNGNSKWLQIQLNGTRGWVCREFTRLVGEVFTTPRTSELVEDCSGQATNGPSADPIELFEILEEYDFSESPESGSSARPSLLRLVCYYRGVSFGFESGHNYVEFHNVEIRRDWVISTSNFVYWFQSLVPWPQQGEIVRVGIPFGLPWNIDARAPWDADGNRLISPEEFRLCAYES